MRGASAGHSILTMHFPLHQCPPQSLRALFKCPNFTKAAKVQVLVRWNNQRGTREQSPDFDARERWERNKRVTKEWSRDFYNSASRMTILAVNIDPYM